MTDVILDGFVAAFAEQRGMSHLPSSELFETFCVSTILRKYHLKLPRFSGHLSTVRRRCPDVEDPSTPRTGVPAPNG